MIADGANWNAFATCGPAALSLCSHGPPLPSNLRVR